MKLRYLHLLFFFISFSALGQKEKKIFPSNIDIHLMPLAVAHPDPSIRIGSEYMTSGRWSYGLSLGAGFNQVLSNPPGWPKAKDSDKYRMFEIRPEVKYYWFRRDAMGWYVALEGVLMSRKNKFLNRSHYLDDSNEIHFDQADFSKSKAGLIGKIGGKFLIKKRLTIDFYTGLGLANTNVKYLNVVNPVAGRSDHFFELENYYPGKKITPLVAVGLKLGFRVWEKE